MKMVYYGEKPNARSKELQAVNRLSMSLSVESHPLYFEMQSEGFPIHKTYPLLQDGERTETVEVSNDNL